MIDRMRAGKRQLFAARVDPALALGIQEPRHDGDCGWDLVAMEDMVIPPMESRDVPVNARLDLPPGVWGLMLARSSIAKRNLAVEAGVIDNGYRGRLFVVLRNMQLPEYSVEGRGWAISPRTTATIQAGERVAQMVFYQDVPIWMTEIEVIDEGTSRGAAGFGSTGRWA
jgi:dUTP pyrophosphatase